ncbi:hypothetical protein, partial [Komagataeibacter melaceti]|uniref:hypothetical protein n=1 Tax=Komagataeibacter melaceti TaxID=2766577 RepID=UPI0019D4E09D
MRRTACPYDPFVINRDNRSQIIRKYDENTPAPPDFPMGLPNAKRPLTRPFKVMILLDLVAGAGFEPAAF